MSKYKRRYLPKFDKAVKKLRSNVTLLKRLQSKIEEIVENPTHYKPLRNVLKNRRRTHIGSYVLIFEIQEERKVVVFHGFQRHDEVYKP